MARRTRNATSSKLYRGWTLEVSGRGPGRWEVVAGKGGDWYMVCLFEGPVSEAFQVGRDWIDERKGLRGVFRSLQDEPMKSRRRWNPCLLMVEDVVRLPSGEEGEVETIVRGQVYVRTRGGQLRGAHCSELELVKESRLRPSQCPARNPHPCQQLTAQQLGPRGIVGCGALGYTSLRTNPSTAALKRKLMGGASRNPTARPLYVDDVTGTRTSPLVHGSTRTPKKVVRTRPAPGEPFQVVEAHGDTLDPRRDTYGIDTGYTDFYRREAARVAKEAEKIRSQEPLRRDADVELGKLGVASTFKNVKAALDEFEDGNEWFFLHPQLDDLDASDITHDFMDRLEVGRGRRATRGGRARTDRKFVRLSDTARGREILRLRGAAQVKAMLKYLFGLAGRRRRWRDVPWYMVEDYMDKIGTLMGEEASLKGSSAGGGGGIGWYPTMSGMLAEDEFYTRIAQEVGPKRARKLERHLNSQALWRDVERLEAILKPPKGPAGKEGRARLKCIPKDDRKILRHRLRVLTDWAKWPELVPGWACVPDEKSRVMTVCTYPAIHEDVLRIEDACNEPYDATWPAQMRRELWDDPAAFEAAGIAPVEEDRPRRPAAEVEDLDLPWETAANPKYKERLPGGRAKGMRPSDFDPKALRRGIEVELEHTRSRELAREIAMDHLAERPDYYEVHAAAGLNPADLQRVHRTLRTLEVVESARSLPQLAAIIQEAGALHREGAFTTDLRDLVAQAAIKVAERRFKYRTECKYPPWDCAQEIVEFVRTRDETMFNPEPAPSAASVQRELRKHARKLRKYVVPNPTTVARVGDATIFVFEENDGYWAQVYDERGPVGARWYGETEADAIELAVEHAHRGPGRGPRRPASPGDTLRSLKAKLIR